MNAIEIKDVTLSRGEFELGPITLDVKKGEIFALLGQTGSGKTVLLETMSGFYSDKYAGQIKIFGEDEKDLPIDARGIGFVYQDSGLFPHMTVEKNIAYGLKMHKVPVEEIEKKISDITELLSISHIRKRYPAMISGGEKQRTALARSLVLSPDILLLDEPFCALDPTTREAMYTEIERIHETFGCTIMFVTHDFREVQRLADRVGILLNGRLRTVKPADELFNDIEDEEVKHFLGRME